MEHRIRLGRLGCVCIAVVLCSFVAAQTAFAQASPKGKIVQMDRESFNRHLRALGYKTRRGIARAKTESDDQHVRSLTHFCSSLTVGGVTYPYTMWAIHRSRGARQSSARSSLRMTFHGFGPNPIVFDPSPAVTNMINSPMYQNAQFANRFGQFGEMMQRATFWNKMDPEREWRVRMKKPRVMKTIDVKVTPETGGLLQIGSAVFGNVLIDFLDALGESAEKMRARTPNPPINPNTA